MSQKVKKTGSIHFSESQSKNFLFFLFFSSQIFFLPLIPRCIFNLKNFLKYFTHDGLPKRVLENGVCAVCGNALHSLSENGSHLNLQNGHTPTVLSEAMEVEEEKVFYLKK